MLQVARGRERGRDPAPWLRKAQPCGLQKAAAGTQAGGILFIYHDPFAIQREHGTVAGRHGVTGLPEQCVRDVGFGFSATPPNGPGHGAQQTRSDNHIYAQLGADMLEGVAEAERGARFLVVTG